MADSTGLQAIERSKFPVPFGLPISFCCKSPIFKLGYLAVVFHGFLVHLSLSQGDGRRWACLIHIKTGKGVLACSVLSCFPYAKANL
jgi:hypothetical protein